MPDCWIRGPYGPIRPCLLLKSFFYARKSQCYNIYLSIYVCVCVYTLNIKIGLKNKACKEYAIISFTSSLLCIVLLRAIIRFQFLFSFLLALSFVWLTVAKAESVVFIPKLGVGGGGGRESHAQTTSWSYATSPGLVKLFPSVNKSRWKAQKRESGTVRFQKGITCRWEEIFRKPFYVTSRTSYITVLHILCIWAVRKWASSSQLWIVLFTSRH